jgi:hypothetical protein
VDLDVSKNRVEEIVEKDVGYVLEVRKRRVWRKDRAHDHALSRNLIDMLGNKEINVIFLYIAFIVY